MNVKTVITLHQICSRHAQYTTLTHVEKCRPLLQSKNNTFNLISSHFLLPGLFESFTDIETQLNRHWAQLGREVFSEVSSFCGLDLTAMVYMSRTQRTLVRLEIFISLRALLHRLMDIDYFLRYVSLNLAAAVLVSAEGELWNCELSLFVFSLLRSALIGVRNLLVLEIIINTRSSDGVYVNHRFGKWLLFCLFF